MIFLAEIHLQPERHVFDGNNAHKSVTTFHNFGSGSIFIFIFFPDRVIQQVKKMWPNEG